MEDKSKYEMMAAQDKIRYEMELSNYKQNNPDKPLFLKLHLIEKKRKPHNTLKKIHPIFGEYDRKVKEEQKKYQKPASAFGMFYKDHIEEVMEKANNNYKLYTKTAGEMWKNLSQEERDEYHKKRRELFEHYDKRMKDQIAICELNLKNQNKIKAKTIHGFSLFFREFMKEHYKERVKNGGQ